MPKRRTTRNTSSKPKATADRGKMKDRTSVSDKEEQMTMTLSEFDANVATALADLKKSAKSATLLLNKKRDAAISAIPSEIRHLTIKEFAALGGTFENALLSLQKVKLDKTKRHRAKILDEIKAIQCDNPRTKSEDDENEVVAELQTVQTAIRKGQRRRLKSTLRTPAVTPKFDPNLPVTPENIRQEKPGERLMSLAGTPVERNKVAKNRIEDTLKECGLTPSRIEKVFGTLSNAIGIE